MVSSGKGWERVGTAENGNEGREKNFDSKIESEGNMEERYGCDLVLTMKDTQIFL